MTAAFDSAYFRSVLGHVPTSVVVVTGVDKAGNPFGITIGSFASVSLDPPLVLWSPARSSKRFEHFARAERFVIHVLGADQRTVSEAFTRSKSAFDGLDWAPNHAGVPVLAGAAAVFECNFEAAYEAGDHDIVIGRVTRAHQGGGAPLVFHQGRFGDFASA